MAEKKERRNRLFIDGELALKIANDFISRFDPDKEHSSTHDKAKDLLVSLLNQVDEIEHPKEYTEFFTRLHEKTEVLKKLREKIVTALKDMQDLAAESFNLPPVSKEITGVRDEKGNIPENYDPLGIRWMEAKPKPRKLPDEIKDTYIEELDSFLLDNEFTHELLTGFDRFVYPMEGFSIDTMIPGIGFEKKDWRKTHLGVSFLVMKSILESWGREFNDIDIDQFIAEKDYHLAPELGSSKRNLNSIHKQRRPLEVNRFLDFHDIPRKNKKENKRTKPIKKQDSKEQDFDLPDYDYEDKASNRVYRKTKDLIIKYTNTFPSLWWIIDPQEVTRKVESENTELESTNDIEEPVKVFPIKLISSVASVCGYDKRPSRARRKCDSEKCPDQLKERFREIALKVIRDEQTQKKIMIYIHHNKKNLFGEEYLELSLEEMMSILRENGEEIPEIENSESKDMAESILKHIDQD